MIQRIALVMKAEIARIMKIVTLVPMSRVLMMFCVMKMRNAQIMRIVKMKGITAVITMEIIMGEIIKEVADLDFQDQ